MIFFPNAAWVSFPLSTLTENATMHFLCAIAGVDLSVAPLLTASANVAVFLAFCSEPLGMALPDPFFRRDPFIASKFGVSLLPVTSAGDDASSSDLVFLLHLERSSSKLLRVDFFDCFGSFSRVLLWSSSPSLLDFALRPCAVLPVVLVAFSTSLIFLPPAPIGVLSGFDVDFCQSPF